MKELISIIIPVYKVEQYLDKCVNSVVGQTYKNLEIILVDDGSPDNCPTMCDNWAKKDNRVKVIHKQNGGLSDARNIGIENATGRYIMFLDSDDFIASNMCEKLIMLQQSKDYDFVGCGLYKFFDPNDIKLDNGSKEIFEFVGDEKLTPLLNPSLIQDFVVSCAKLFKREIFNDIKYPIGKLHEDEFVITDIINTVNTYAITSEKLYFYLQRAGSITMGRKEKNAIDSLDAYERRYTEYLIKYHQVANAARTAFLLQLREIYLIYHDKLSRGIKKRIFTRFKEVYRETKRKSCRDFAFRWFRWLYVMYIRIKN